MKFFNLSKRRPKNHLARCLEKLSRRLSPGEFSDVVAAWRGPDLHDDGLKERTTCIIRRAILNEIPGWSDFTCFRGLTLAKEVKPIYLPCYSYSRTNSHFHSHILHAACALGIKVRIEEEEKNG